MIDYQKPLLIFPCEFPIKVFGAAIPEFATAVAQIIRKHIPDFDTSTFNIRPSKGKRYQAITLTITATSQTQLDTIYLELSAHELIIMTL